MLKVMTILGTRPEVIKLSLVMKKLEIYTDHILVHTGQHYDYELNQIFFEDLDIKKPDYFLNSVGSNYAETIGNIISKSDNIIEREKPDAILIYGDTNSSLSVISAKRRHVPIFHMEAGNRCFDQRVPEELNRKVVDHLSDINLVISEHARRYLIAEGIKPETILKTGSCMREVYETLLFKNLNSKIMQTLRLRPRDFFIVSMHREENLESRLNMANFVGTLNRIAETYKKTIIFSTHPRTRAKLNNTILHDLIRLLNPLSFSDYIRLQENSLCVISDSGTLSEESAICGFPAVMIRETHERPEAMDETSVIMSGLKSNRVLESIDMAIKQGFTKKVVDYETEDVSTKVVRIIQSYTDYVNRTVWYKI